MQRGPEQYLTKPRVRSAEIPPSSCQRQLSQVIKSTAAFLNPAWLKEGGGEFTISHEMPGSGLVQIGENDIKIDLKAPCTCTQTHVLQLVWGVGAIWPRNVMSNTFISVDDGVDWLHTSLDSQEDQKSLLRHVSCQRCPNLHFFRTVAAQVQRKHICLLEYTQTFCTPPCCSNSNSLGQVSSERVLFLEELQPYKKQGDAPVWVQPLGLPGWDRSGLCLTPTFIQLTCIEKPSWKKNCGGRTCSSSCPLLTFVLNY